MMTGDVAYQMLCQILTAYFYFHTSFYLAEDHLKSAKPYSVGYLTIYSIQCHVHNQTNADESYPGHIWYKAEHAVERNNPQLMEWVKPGTATV